MKPRTVVVLAVLVVALAGFVWFVERDLPSSEERAEEAKRLLPFEPEEVTGVTIEWDGRPVRLERTAPGTGDGGGAAPASSPEWRIVEPLDARADGSAVESLLETLSGLESRRRIDDADPAAVGLDEPKARVQVRTAGEGGEGAWVLRIGAEVPTSEAVLVGRTGAGGGDEEVHVTSGSFVERLRREPGAWRDRDLFAATRSAVQRLVLLSPGAAEGPVALARAGEHFRIEEPVDDLADPDRVDDLLSELVTLRAERFVDDPAEMPGEGAFEPVAGTVEAELDGARTFRVELGPPIQEPALEGGPGTAGTAGSSERLVRAEGQIAVVSTDLAALVAPEAGPGSWRSRAWTTLRPYQVETLEIGAAGDGAERGREPLALGRSDGAWLRDGRAIPSTVVGDLLAAVTDAEGEVVDDPVGVAGEAEPILTLSLKPRQHDPVTLTLLPASGGTHLATSSLRSAAVRLGPEAVRAVLDAVEAVRTAEPSEAEPVVDS